MMTTRTKAILGVTGVFLLGALIGAAALGLYVTAKVTERESLRDPVRFRDYFVDRLDLDQAQSDSVADELARTYDDLLDVRVNVDEEYRIIFDSLDQRISSILTAEQRLRLREQRNRFLPRRRHARSPYRMVRPEQTAEETVTLSDDSATVGDVIDDGSSDDPGALSSESEPTSSDRDASKGAETKNADGVSAASIDSTDPKGTTPPKLIGLIAEKLDLTAEQQTELETILRESMKRGKKIRRKHAANPDVMQRNLMINRLHTDRRFKDILTAEQLPQYEKLKAQLLNKLR